MIPVKLALKNFMPYREAVPPLYFNDIHTASIWGDNGNGKSSLIDAMTWALWGKTRAKSDDDIIHLGANETEVEFDFSVNDILYRVIRKHARPKRKRGSGQTILDFQVSDSDGGFRSIAGNTIPQTQQQIIDVLHMDYNTFVNSAYLRQGHSDEFTQQQPVKRKEVLSNILGLSRYDRLEEEARERARQKETERVLAENAIRDIGEELAHRPEYEAELKQAQAELTGLDRQLQDKEKEVGLLRQKKELHDSRKQQVSQLDRHMAESTRTKELLQNQLGQANTRIRDYEDLINGRSVIEDGYNRYLETKKLADDLDKKFRLVSGLNEKKYKLEMDIYRAGQVLENEKSLVENTISRLNEAVGKQDSLKSDLVKAEQEFAALSGEETAIEQRKEELREKQTELANLEVTGTRIRQEVAEIGEKLELLSARTGAKCPVCERELGEEHRALIEKKYAEEQQQKTALLEKTRQDYARLSKALKTDEQSIKDREKKLTQARTDAQKQISLINRDMQEVEKAGNQLQEETGKLAALNKRVEDNDYAQDQQALLVQVVQEIAETGYDAEQHESVSRELQELVKNEEPKRRLDEALKNIDADKKSAAQAEETITGLSRSITEDEQKKKELEAELESQPELEEELAKVDREYREIGTRQKESQESVGRLKGILQRSEQLQVRADEKRKQLDQAVREEQIYRDLARAFGKRGIQMWLIETAIPEIEIEANKLLNRMTDGRMSINILTQKATKSGTTLETLDINITDELGTRNYEMFSGGEAFRIDFAIRIALSKLLARRAGAPLPTLIIDEGFGTQDTKGLEKLKEAIISIQDDFKKILVVTHIEEFRDAFPTRIDIVKTPDGSTIEVN